MKGFLCFDKALPMLYHCEKTTTVKFCGHRSYKTRESTLYCIGNSEENMDLSVIYLAVIRENAGKEMK